MESLKMLVPQFARQNCTPFLHRQLYKDNMPRWVLQAFSTCMLYTNRTGGNRGMILRFLHENVTDLLGSATGTNLTPQERLARVHALMMYQVIRMLDGDIFLATQADDNMALLDSWLVELCKVRDNLAEEARMEDTAIRDKPPESWERWIFTESVRKTCIFGYSQITFWNVLKGRQVSDDLGVWAYVHRWTLSSHLWNATDSFSFFEAWKNRPFYIIAGFQFENFLKTGSGDDLDDFARIFLTIWFGLSEIKKFCLETSRRRLP
ncbi:hypothetical protein BJ170DRAFT_24302 [Xylariales sp. AK1849]|nr:hypothetical protein BJ170DRAFT_24302 [Xylariales sp. AK1849]